VFPPDQYAGRPASQPRVTQGVALSYGPVATSSPFRTPLWPPLPPPTLTRSPPKKLPLFSRFHLSPPRQPPGMRNIIYTCTVIHGRTSRGEEVKGLLPPFSLNILCTL